MGKVSKKLRKPNRQSERTKSWIFDAVMILMNEKPYNKITVSDITEKAGIARTTFYRNYKEKDDVVFECLNKTFITEILTAEKDENKEKQNTIVILFDYKFMIKHQKNLKKILSTTDIENRIFREVQKYPISIIERFKKMLPEEEYALCRFKICYQLTGSLRVIFDWFINNMPRPVEYLILLINSTNNPNTVKYRNFPNIVFQLKDK
ncbi:MAG: TetR/AcrR family transcriptional regulator [Treponema sp.]|nr:TetR/AcrR family transcriptional regulator [Treponema sp.]